MRTGAIFARGSCKALGWALVLGALVVLTAGGAAAQPTKITVSSTKVEVDEQGVASFRVSLDKVAVADTDVVVSVTRSSVGTNFIYSGGANAAGWTTRPQANHAPGAIIATIEFLTGTKGPVTIGVMSGKDTDASDQEEVLGFTSGALGVASVTITQDDPDQERVLVSPRSLTISEGGYLEYEIWLESAPDAAVTISPRVTNRNTMVELRVVDPSETVPATGPTGTADDGLLDSWDEKTGTLVFDATPGADASKSMWDDAIKIRVFAMSDANTISGTATIRHSVQTIASGYNDITAGPPVTVNEIDSVRTVSVSASADSVMEGESVNITARLGHPETDYAGSLALSEDVTIKLSIPGYKSTHPAAGSFSPTSPTLVIAAGTVAKTVTLEATHDTDDDDETLSFTSSVTGSTTVVLGDAQELTLAIEDDDAYTLTSNKLEVNEGEEATLTVEVEPKAAKDTDVRLELYRASGATVEPGPGDVPDYVTINEGDTEAEFTLKTVKDADSEGETIVVRAKAGGGIVGEDLTIMVLDGQVYTLSLEPDSIGEADGEASVMVKVETNKVISSTKDTMLTLAVDPTSTATAMDDYSIMPAEMMVMIAKGEKMGMITLMVTPVADSMDESNETIVLTAWKDGKQEGNAVTLTIIDGDSPGSGITPKSDDDVGMVFSDAIEMAGGLMVGGNMVSVDMSMLFNMTDTSAEVMYTATSSDESVLGASSSGSMLTLDPMMEGMSTISVEAKPAGMASARGAVTAFTCSGACVSVILDVAAAATFMLTASGTDLVEGGMAHANGTMGMITLTATATSAVVEDTEVMIMRDRGNSDAVDEDFMLEPMMITIEAGTTSGTATLTAEEDEMPEEAEMLMLYGMVGTMQTNSVTVTIWDMAVPALPLLAQLLLGGLLAVGGFRRYRRR